MSDEIDASEGETLLAIATDLKYCPICAWGLNTIFVSHRVITKRCQNHGRVFIIRRVRTRWFIETNLGDG
jgi:hypothetical protein